jgi:hypothetical protein
MSLIGLKKVGEVEDIEEIEECGDEFEWEISFTLEGSSKVMYDYVRDREEMQAYIKALKVVGDWEKDAVRQKRADLQADLKAFKDLKKLMPNAELTKDIAQAKKLLTDVNKTQVREKVKLS